MTRVVLLSAGLVFAVELSAAPLWMCDFNNHATAERAQGTWRIAADGQSARNGEIAFDAMKLGGWTNLPERVKFSCEVHELSRNPARPGHWGFNFTAADGTHLHTHCQGQGLIAWITSPSGRHLAESNVGRRDAKKGWTKLEFEFTPSGTIGRLGGETVIQYPLALKPVNGDVLFYNVDAEMRNLRFEALPPAAKGPVFSEEQGGFMCWARYGRGKSILKFLDAEGGVKGHLTAAQHGYIIFTWFAEGREGVSYQYQPNHNFTRNEETYHLAFSWTKDGRARFYVNGVPYCPDQRSSDRRNALMLGNEMAKVAKVVPGVESKTEQTPQELRVFNRPLTNQEVYEEYRRRMPIDLQVLKDVPVVGEQSVFTLTAVPGGTYLKPKPFDGCGPTKAKVGVSIELHRIRMKSSRPYESEYFADPVEGASVEFRDLAVDGPVDLKTRPARMEKGSYRATVKVNGYYSRSIFFSVSERVKVPTAKPSADEWTLGRTVYEKTFAKPSDVEYHQGTSVAGSLCGAAYLESGANGGLAGDRWGTVIPFEGEDFGRPFLMTFTWPDDKTRAMGLVMLPETTSPTHRDALQAGLFAGDMYRTTGIMQESSYLFYPNCSNYLFECRTQIDGRPAALAKLTVREIVGAWPVLKVNAPKGLPARRFGYQDEDQSLMTNFKGVDQSPEGCATEVLRYLKYTGQDVFAYGAARYWTTMGPIELSEGEGGMGLWPCRTDHETDVIRAFGEAGVDWMGITYMGRTPEQRYAHLIDGRNRDGWFTCDRDGNERIGDAQRCGSPASKEMNEAYLDNFIDNLATLRAAGMVSVRHELYGSPYGTYGAWRSLDWGYDDITMKRFTATTGVSLPAGCGDRDGSKRFRARYDFLTASNSVPREKWLKWRSEQVTAFVKFYREKLDAIDGKMPLVLPVGSGAFSGGAADGDTIYEKHGVDLDALAKIRGVRFAAARNPTGYLFGLYRRSMKREDYHGDAKNNDLGNTGWKRLRELSGGSLDLVCEATPYWETFRNSLVPKRFAAYFQVLDCKPWGRNFLRSLAYDVAMFDAKALTIGNLVMGTLGSEREAREFARAFRALPAVPFVDVFAEAGVVCRALPTANGTYFYLVSAVAEGRKVSVAVRVPGKTKVVDLSTRDEIDPAAIALRPFELRSFLVPFENAEIKGVVNGRE